MSQTPSKAPANPPAKKERQKAVVTTGIHFSGPLPPPAVLEGYERLIPGAAERLISLVEADTKHLQDLEKSAQNADISSFRLGQVLGFTIVLVALSVAAFCAYLGHEWPASIIGGTTVVGLAYAFVLGRKNDEPQDSRSRKK